MRVAMRRQRTITRLFAFIFIAVSCLSGCSSHASSHVGDTAQRTIEPDGGRVSIAEVAELAVPEGAMDEDTEFTITVIAQKELETQPDEDDFAAAGSIVSIDTDAEQLFIPAKLTLNYDKDADVDKLIVLHFKDGDYSVLQGEIDEDARTITVETDNFSDFGVFENNFLHIPDDYITPNKTYTFDTADECFTAYDIEGLIGGKDTWGIVYDPTEMMNGGVAFCTATHNGRSSGAVSGFEKNMKSCLQFMYKNDRTDVKSMALSFDVYMNIPENFGTELKLQFRAATDTFWMNVGTGAASGYGSDIMYVYKTDGKVMHITYNFSNYGTILNALSGTSLWGDDDFPVLHFRLVLDNGKKASPDDGELYGTYIDNLTLNVTYNNGVAASTPPASPTPGATETEIEVSWIELSESRIELDVGETAELEVDFHPEDATDQTITWSSDDEDVATVSDEGVVTAVGEGTAYITAKASNGEKDKCKVTVDLPEVESVTLSETELEIEVGHTEPLTVTILPEAADQEVTWSTSRSAVATVQDGVVTAMAEGTATITAKAANGKKATCVVTVVPDTNLDEPDITIDGQPTGVSSSSDEVAVSSYYIRDDIFDITIPVVEVYGNESLSSEINAGIEDFVLYYYYHDDYTVRLDTEYVVCRNSGGVLSIYLECYIDGGGAHPYTSYQSINYDVRNGTKIEFADLFAAGFDYEEMYMEYAAKYCEENGFDSWVLGNFKDPLTSPYVNISDHFCITTDSIYIFFAYDDVTGLGYGNDAAFEIPLADLEGNLNSNYF